MKLIIFLLLTTATMLTGCVSLSVPGRFSPVQGPLSKQSPIPTYSATLSGFLSGTISVIIENGEVCKGPWAFVSKSAPEKNDAGSGGPASSNMAADWDTVYGAGYYVAHVVGNKLYARAALTGNRGTTIRAEFSNEHNERGQTKGVAEDNNGNVFKVSVYN
jgi:hypothetical protein